MIRLKEMKVGLVRKSEAVVGHINLWTGSGYFLLKAEADSGSDCTMVTLDQFADHFQDLQLESVEAELQNFDWSAITAVRGRFKTNIRFEQNECPVIIYVVDNCCEPIIGRDIMEPLGLVVDFRRMALCKESKFEMSREATAVSGPLDTHPKSQIKSVKTTDDYKNILWNHQKLLQTDMGTYPDYQHEIKLMPDAVPVVMWPQLIPLAQQEKVLKETDVMDKAGIWEPIDRADWVHQLVAVPKPNGDVRLTSDLSPLNPSIVPVHYPLPTFEDLKLKLAGAKVYSKIDLRKGFFHVQLAESSHPLTATMTPKGHKCS